MKKKKAKKPTQELSTFAFARESFGKIRVNLDFLSVDKAQKCVFFTSAISGEGKSTVAANLAISMASSDKKTLLVDADLRNASLHRMFNLVNRTGLSEIITKRLNWKDYVNDANIPNLHVLTAGRMPPNPSELLSSQSMGKIVEEMKEQYDFIIFDTPPVLVVPDPVSLSRHMDGAIIVTRHHYTTIKAVLAAKEALKLANCPILASILNEVSEKSYRYNYHYGYGYGYGYRYRYGKDSANES